MNDKDIVLKSIELVQAIRKNDLENTKVLVEYLNTNFDPEKNNVELGNVIQVGALVDDFSTNESLIYMVENLQNLPTEEVKWFIKFRKILDASIPDQEAFLLENLNENLQDYQAINLITLAVHIHKYDLLDAIYNLVEKL